jgi:hypothetical protein
VFWRIAILVLFLMSSAPVLAETVSCPWKNADVTLDIEPDMGGDYDENATHYEWNALNFDKEKTPTVAHCLSRTDPQETVDITIPAAIKRCVLNKGKFLCRSGTISYPGYVDSVRLDLTEKDGTVRTIKPVTIKVKNGRRMIWKNLDKNNSGSKQVAYCSERDLPKNIFTVNIPKEMKECALMDRRFRCTATPNRFDLFWPNPNKTSAEDKERDYFPATGTSSPETIACHGRILHALVEAGESSEKNKNLSYPAAIEEDITRGDDDELPPQLEWNALNENEKSTPATLHCFHNEDDKAESIETIALPATIKRCIYRAHKTVCQGGTFSCTGVVDGVQIEAEKPEASTPILVAPNLARNGKAAWSMETIAQLFPDKTRFFAHCFPSPERGKSERKEIPRDMKECSFTHSRFRCTTTPEHHDLFWPKD